MTELRFEWAHPIKPELMRAIHRLHRQEIKEKFAAMMRERFQPPEEKACVLCSADHMGEHEACDYCIESGKLL